VTAKRVLEKRLRMTLDFEVTVEELTDEGLREFYRQFAGGEESRANPEEWAGRSRQIRLQRALLEDDGALRRFITYVVTNEVDSSLDSRLREAFGVGGERADEAILESVFSRLDAEDAEYFLEASRSESLFEAVEALSRSVRVRQIGADISEVIVAAEPTAEGAE
jgi:hypothetical protein